jgi:hypothetical protein
MEDKMGGACGTYGGSVYMNMITKCEGKSNWKMCIGGRII